jgi:2-polyprenyl-3-methyl-5-hydroxy-6-metoxy-1,4-benzoquinol methylase
MNLKEFRNRIYKNYVVAREKPLAPSDISELMHQSPYLNHIIKKFFPPDHAASILDLGCGYGAIIYFSHKEGYTNIRGIENSPEQIRAANRLGIDNIEEGDLICAISELPEKSQDCIVTFDVIEHFTREELIPLIDNIYKILKPGGCWIIHTPNGESPFGGKMRYGDITHEIAFTRTSLAQLLFSSGFNDVKCFEDTPIIHGVKSFARWFLWKISRNILRLFIMVETGESERKVIFSQNFLTIAIK